MPRTPTVTGLLLLVLAATLPVHAQVELMEPPPQQREAELVADQFLALHGQIAAVGYLTGYLDRASNLLRRLELVSVAFNDWGPVPTPTTAYVLDRVQWRQAELPGIYGLPLRSGPTGLVVPAVGDDGTVQLWRYWLGVQQLPPLPGIPMQGSPEWVSSLAMADVLVQVEAARGFVQRANLLGADAWVGEVAAHVASLVLMYKNERARLAEIAWFYSRLKERVGQLAPAKLDEFTPVDLFGDREQVERWLAFQGEFHAGARVIFAKDGKGSVKQLLKMSEKAGGVLPESELVSRYPGFSEWLSDLRARR